MSDFKQRCQAILDKIRMDSMLRQGSPVETLMEFVVSERGREAFPPNTELYPLILYLGNDADRDELIAAFREVHPGAAIRKIP